MPMGLPLAARRWNSIVLGEYYATFRQLVEAMGYERTEVGYRKLSDE